VTFFVAAISFTSSERSVAAPIIAYCRSNVCVGGHEPPCDV
jgi:hypothetical protein